MQQLLGAACAVGVASSFGSTVGGVFFSIEVTSTYYLVETLWKGLFVAVCGATVVALFGQLGTLALVTTESELLPRVSASELPLFVLLGCLGGVLGAVLVRMLSFAVNTQKRPFFATKIG